MAVIFLALSGAALWGLFKGIQYSVRGFTDRENRGELFWRAAGGFLLVGVITYPIFLGPVVAKVACASGVGYQAAARTDLRSDGYLIDWDGPGEGLMAHAVEDLLLGRISFFETSSFRHDRALRHFSLQPDVSRDCINPELLLGERRLPRGMCLAASVPRVAASSFKIDTSAGTGKSDAFQTKISLVERGTDRVVASYTRRRIPYASMAFTYTDPGVYCPVDKRAPPWFGLTDDALMNNESFALTTDKAHDPQPCTLPPLPENVEVHKYRSEGGRRRVDVNLQIGRDWTTENDVYVNRPGVPVVLWLRNSRPVLWRIRKTDGSRIVAVIAEGYEGAVAVSGVAASVPLLIASKNYGRMSNCLKYQIANEFVKLKLPLASDINGDKNYAGGREVIPFVIGPKLPESEYAASGEISESRYALAR